MNNQARYEELSQRLQSSEEFKNRFLSEPKSVLREMGINLPDSVRVEVHEDTAQVKNIVIPESLPEEDQSTASNPLYRQIVTKAYEDSSFKAQLMQNSKSAIAELTGESLPEDWELCVYENTPTLRHLVIYVDSASEDLSEKELETVVGGSKTKKIKFGRPITINAPIAGGIGWFPN